MCDNDVTDEDMYLTETDTFETFYLIFTSATRTWGIYVKRKKEIQITLSSCRLCYLVFEQCGKLFRQVENLFWKVGKLFWQVGKLFWQVGKLFWQGRCENYFSRWEAREFLNNGM